MEKFKYIFREQFNELKTNFKYNSLILFSLVIGFLFILTFISKIIDIGEDYKNINLKDYEKVFVYLSNLENDSEEKIVDKIINNEKHDYFTKFIKIDSVEVFYGEKDLYITDITLVEGKLDQFENFSVSEIPENQVILIDKIAKSLNIKVSDEIYVYGKRLIVNSIVEKFHGDILVNQSDFKELENRPSLLDTLFIKLSSKSKNYYNWKTGEEYINSLRQSQIRFGMFSFCLFFLFFILSVINLSLIFIGKYERYKFNFGIKQIFGAGKRDILYAIVIENLIFTSISSILLYLLLKPLNELIPSIFKININYLVLSISFIVNIFISLIISLAVYLKFRNSKIVDLLR